MLSHATDAVNDRLGMRRALPVFRSQGRALPQPQRGKARLCSLCYMEAWASHLCMGHAVLWTLTAAYRKHLSSTVGQIVH